MTDKLIVQEGNETILGMLQQCVDAETSSRNLYFARSVFWRNVGLTKLADYYLTQSQEIHCQLSADRMAFLGRQPGMSPSTMDAITEDQDVAEQYRVDLQVEVALADDYASFIKVAEQAGDYVTRNVWQTVLASTQEHVDYLQGELNKLSLVGAENYLATWM
jgi:bacterioferritin